MADHNSLPLTSALRHNTEGAEPGFGTVLTSVLKDGIGFAVVGALVGVVVTAAMGLAMGPANALSFIGSHIVNISAGGPLSSLIVSGMAIGGVTGAMVGIPTGGVMGVSKIKHYYQDVALPTVARKGVEVGIQQGAALEHQAMQHELTSRKYREMIAHSKEQLPQPGVGV